VAALQAKLLTIFRGLFPLLPHMAVQNIMKIIHNCFCSVAVLVIFCIFTSEIRYISLADSD